MVPPIYQQEFTELVAKMMIVDPEKRLTCTDLLEQEFVKRVLIACATIDSSPDKILNLTLQANILL